MIILKEPTKNETVSLLTDVQKRFILSDRSCITCESFDVLNLKVSGSENSMPNPVVFKWNAETEAELQISVSEDFKELISVKAVNECSAYNLESATKYF